MHVLLHFGLLTCFHSVLLFRRVLGHGIRYGEARNPGPEMLHFGLCNPTSLTNKADAFRTLQQSYDCHFIAFAETSATSTAQSMVQRQMRRLGYFSAFTTAAPSLRARADHQISLRGKATGCACFCRAPVRFPRCQQLLHSGMDLRLLHIVIDEWKLQMVVLYGLARSNVGAQEFNDSLLAAAAQRVQQVNLPSIIMGDFNSDVFQMPAASSLARRGFLHLQQLHLHMYGVSMPPTCKEATNPDTAFLSPLFDAHKVVLFSLHGHVGNLTKQIWPRPKPFTDLVMPSNLLEAADQDLSHLPPPATLEAWGTRVEQTIDVALRKAPSGANLPKNLPRVFRGRCQPTEGKQILITTLVPKARCGGFEPECEIHRAQTASMIKQLRRLQSLLRKRDKCQNVECLLAEWRKILYFKFNGLSFVAWISQLPELAPVPWNLPTSFWLSDLVQLWRHEVQSAIHLDQKIFQDKLHFRLQQDKKSGHNKLTFTSVRGSTPTLESVECKLSQQAILVPLPCRIASKSHERFEAFVENASEFQIGQPIFLDQQPGWLHEIRDSSVVVSCSSRPNDLEQVEIEQRVLSTNPNQICQQLSQFWLPLWQRDDSHLLSPELDTQFDRFLYLLPNHCIKVDVTSLSDWQSVIKGLRWNAAPGPDGITAFELQSLPVPLIESLIRVVNSYQAGFPAWFMSSRVFAAPKGQGIPAPGLVRPITVLSQIYHVWAQVICRQILRAFGQSMTYDITGLLPGRGAFEAAYTAQWFFEQAHHLGEHCAGVTLDLVKCFNAINRSRGISILARLGVPQPILHQWAQSLAHLTRRWEVCGQCSDPLPSCCGFPEGDVFSVLVMLGVAQCWTIACRCATSTQPMLSAYADNWAWAVKDLRELQPILEITLHWTSLIGLRIDWSKTWWWASHNNLASSVRAVFAKLQLPVIERVQFASDLGCPLRYQGAARLAKLCHRLQKAKERLARLKYSHADIDVRAQVISASIYSVAFHGAELFPLGQQHTKSLRYHVAEALVGPSESMSSALVTLCASKYVRDPELHLILNACAAARRFLLTQPRTTQLAFFNLVAKFFPRPNTSKGLASTLKAYIARLGWSFDAQGMIQISTFVRVEFLTCPWCTLTLFAERAWQDKLLLQHTHRRSLMHFPNIDQHLTRSVLAKFTPGERRLLVREIAGAFQTRSQQAVWDDQIAPECPWCGQEDTKYHRYFSCAATQSVREPFSDLISTVLEVDTLLPDLPVVFESGISFYFSTCTPGTALGCCLASVLTSGHFQ